MTHPQKHTHKNVTKDGDVIRTIISSGNGAVYDNEVSQPAVVSLAKDIKANDEQDLAVLKQANQESAEEEIEKKWTMMHSMLKALIYRYTEWMGD